MLRLVMLHAARACQEQSRVLFQARGKRAIQGRPCNSLKLNGALESGSKVPTSCSNQLQQQICKVLPAHSLLEHWVTRQCDRKY